MNESEKPFAPAFVYKDVPREERDRRIAELRDIKNPILGEIWDKKMVGFLRGLQDKYGLSACESCELYHVAAGSTIPISDVPKTIFDFPGDDSIEKFIRERSTEKREQPKVEIWIVDDQDGIRKLWASVADAMEKVTLMPFEKGEEAIAELQKRLETGAFPPHGIVMDGFLESDDKEEFRNGASVVTVIRSLAKNNARRPFIIAQSSTKDDNDAMTSAGADAVLQKPYRTPAIQAAIEQIEKHHEKTP